MLGCRLPREQRAPQPRPCRGGVRAVSRSPGWGQPGPGTALPRTGPCASRTPRRTPPQLLRRLSRLSGAGGTAAVTSPVSPVPSQRAPAAVPVPCAKPSWKTIPSFKNETPTEPAVLPSWAWACVYSQPSSRPALDSCYVTGELSPGPEWKIRLCCRICSSFSILYFAC